MLVNVLCDQNELRTSQNPARTIPKESKSHHFEGILLSGRFGIPPCGSASICLDLRRVYQLLRGAPPFGRWIGSVPLRGLRPLRSTPPIHLPKGSAPTPDLLNSTPEPAKWMQNRTPVCQIDRIPIILWIWLTSGTRFFAFKILKLRIFQEISKLKIFRNQDFSENLDIFGIPNHH